MTHILFKNRFVFLVSVCFSISIIACDNEQNQIHNTTKKKSSSEIALMNSGNTEISILENQLQKDSLNIDLRFKLAVTYYSMKDFNNALFHLEIVNKIDPQNLKTLINLGNLYYDFHKDEKAIIYYEKALELDSKNINVRCDMATCYLNLKNAEIALKILLENTKIDYNHALTHHNLSVVYSKLGKPKEASAEMEIFNNLKNH